MLLKSFKHQMIFAVKIASVIIITNAISLELWNIYTPINLGQTLSILNIIIWLGRVALIAHFLEAIIAFFYANSSNKSPLKYGVYTFFVGTIGLLELFSQNQHEQEECER